MYTFTPISKYIFIKAIIIFNIVFVLLTKVYFKVNA